MFEKMKGRLSNIGVLEDLKLNATVRSLQRHKAAVQDEYAEKAKAINDQDPQERHYHESALCFEYSHSDEYDDEIQQIASDYYVKNAERLLIPVPIFNAKGPDWTESQFTGRYRLSPDALHTLRSNVRSELKERRELTLMWLAAATGIIGALTGLASVILAGS